MFLTMKANMFITVIAMVKSIDSLRSSKFILKEADFFPSSEKKAYI